jgi:signal transduction histidine kinase
VSVRREEAEAVVDIVDEGAGIPPENLPRVFEPFFTTKHRGTGLGLPITRRVVEAHGGHVELQSQPGRGTTVTLRLPLSPQEEPRSPGAPGASPALFP